MGCLGNLLWFVLGGFWMGLGWLLAGILWCITIIGIPIGTQCFKLAGLAFFPFGKEVEYGGGAGSFLLNIIWMIVSGIPLALGQCNFTWGILKNKKQDGIFLLYNRFANKIHKREGAVL